jgi:hypothetical protein
MESEENKSVKDLLMDLFLANGIKPPEAFAGMFHLIIEQAIKGKNKPGKKLMMQMFSDAWDEYERIKKEKDEK